MQRIAVGTRVRYIGQPHPFNNVIALMLVGHTGTVRAPSTVPGMHWDVDMDEGCYDVDAHESSLRPLDDQTAPTVVAEEEVAA